MVVGQMPEARDVVVIGGGPGGYEAALRAAELGRRVTVVDRDGPAGLGGECLHRGCIPSKTLIEHAHRRGDSTDRSLAAFQKERVEVIEGLRGGVAGLLDARRVEVLAGTAAFVGADRLVVQPDEGPARFLQFTDAVVATGSANIDLPDLPVDGDVVLDAAGLLARPSRPDRTAVVGGGYIGVELGTALAHLGTEVTVVEMAPSLLSTLDADLARVVADRMGHLGVTIHLSTRVVGRQDGELLYDGPDGPGRIPVDCIVVAAGRRPRSDVRIEAAGGHLLPSGHIATDPTTRRATPHVYAIGDVVDGPALAHKASAEGRMVAEILAGVAGHRDVQTVPAIVYSDPELASVGATAADARASDGELVTGRAPLAASGRARTMGRSDGFVRLVAERATGTVVGAQVAAPHASELIAVATTAIELCATVGDLEAMVFAHPTLSESFADAARAAIAAGALT